MSKLLLKLSSALIILVSLFFVLPSPAYAAGNWVGSFIINVLSGIDMLIWEGCPPLDEVDAGLWAGTFAEVAWAGVSRGPLAATLTGVGALVSQETFVFTCSEDLVGAGAINITGNFIAALYDQPPVSTGEYLADVGSRLGLATPAYAQGIGFSAFLPVLTLWKAFRSIAYIFYIVIFIVVGFMIMFRSKINPQTIVTLQAALPNLIITLLLITFSYAIAGFLVDLMYWLLYALVAFLEATHVLKQGTFQPTISDFIFGRSIVEWKQVLPGTFKLVKKAVAAAWQGGGISLLIPSITFGIFILTAMVKTLIELLKAYLLILLYVITGPVQILFNAVPGTQAFLNWLRCLTANVLVFPAVAAFLLLGAALVGTAAKGQHTEVDRPQFESNIGYNPEGQAGFLPPFIIRQGRSTITIGGEEVPLIQVVQGLLGMAIILVLPNITKMTTEALKCGVKDQGQIIFANFQEATGYLKKGYSVPGKFTAGYQQSQSGTTTFFKIIAGLFRSLG